MPSRKPTRATVSLLLVGVVAALLLGVGAVAAGWSAPSRGSEGSASSRTSAGHSAAGPSSPAAESASRPSGSSEPLLHLLDTIEVKGRAPKTGYNRTLQFGQAWEDVDANGCDTRNDILARDLVGITVDERCRVLTGILNDPYTGQRIDFIRGSGTSAEVQIDHVVSLMDAWQKGAQQMTPEQRLAFANDPQNLLAVDGAANQQKGAGDAATWLPANKAFRCEYVGRQVTVKAKWRLWATNAEMETMRGILEACP